jgi:hypothetical protein
VVPGLDPDSNQGSLHQNFLPPSQKSKLPFITNFKQLKLHRKKKTIKCKNQNFNTNQRNPSLKMGYLFNKSMFVERIEQSEKKIEKIGENKNPNLKAKMNKPRSSE